MLLIIGAYRGANLVHRAIESILDNARGISSIVVVDDSGDTAVRAELASHDYIDRVIPVADERAGYNAAMTRVCEVAGDSPFVFWEEDFELLEWTDFDDMRRIVGERPYLAQLALLRGPHFANEHEHGGLLPALEARLPGSVRGELDGVIEQTGTFTANPSVWAPGIASRGWPRGQWSEDRKRDDLLAEGFSFGYLPGVRVAHDGDRTGFGY